MEHIVKNNQKKFLEKPVSIIIINYKSEKPLISCLEQIYSSLEAKNKLETIVINNGTGDSKLIKKISKTPYITFVDTGTNSGFAAGVNVGIATAKHDLILLLNPDTLATFKSIRLLTKCLQRNKAGIVGGVNYRFNKERHDTCVRKPNIYTYLFDYTNLRKLVSKDIFHKRHYYLDEPPSINKKQVDAVSGSFMLIDRKVINKIGLFDERFFMYLEDVDYCLRAGEAGFKVLFCPKSSIEHIGGYSSKNKERVRMSAWLESRRRYVLKHEGFLTNIIVQPIFAVDSLIIKLLQKYR